MSNESTEPTREQVHEMCQYLSDGGCCRCDPTVTTPYGDGEPGCYGIALQTLQHAAAILRPAEREGGHECAYPKCDCSPVERCIQPAKEPCPRCQKPVTAHKDGRLHQHTRVKYGIRVTCQDEETIDERE